jgi:hypothetical protein
MRIKRTARKLFYLGLTAILSGNLVGGCAPYSATFVWERPASRQCESDIQPPREISNDNDLCVWSYQGRLYVFGSRESGRNFSETPAMNDGFLEAGAGPSGEDVVFEKNGDHPEFVEELQERYHGMPKLLWRVDREYSVWTLKGRIFVLGANPVVERDFIRSRELVLSKTFFGAGPKGETVVVEASKSKNQFADLLMERFNARPILIEKRCPDYFVWRQMGRVLVVGSAASSFDLETGRELVSTRALIGAGPNGETVVFETDSRRPELLQRLATVYFGEGEIPAGLLAE